MAQRPFNLLPAKWAGCGFRQATTSRQACALTPRRLLAIDHRKKDTTMIIIYDALQLILGVVYAVMIVHIIMSWLINFQVLNLHQPLVSQIWYGLNRLLEPLYNRIRRFLPDTGTLDLAPLVALLIVILLTNSVLPTVFGLR
jgi:YggT family protein